MSIQVKLGGRSFSAHNINVAEEVENIEIVVDTPRTTLAPRSEVSLDTASELLRLAGKACRHNEQSVCSELQADIVAVMAIDEAALASIIEKWGSKVSFTSPLLDMRHSDEECITIDMSEEVCYMRHFENGLQCAESFDTTAPEDVLYLAAERANSGLTPIYIKGSKAAAKLLRKYFKRVICE